MKIVHIEDFFHPDAGYQPNVLTKYMTKLGYDVTIVTSQMEKMPDYLTGFFGKDKIIERDKAFADETGVNIIRVPIHRYYSGRSIYKHGIFKIIDEIEPDVLYVHGEDTYIGIRTILRLKRFGYPVLFDDHMVEMASHNKIAPIFRWYYRTFVMPKLKRYRATIIRTENDDYIFKHYGIPQEQSPYIGHGSDTMLFHPDNEIKRKTRDELGIPQENFVFIYAGKMDETKGGMLLADTIHKPMKSPKPVSFLIVGNCSGFDESYAEKVEKEIAASENHVVRVPTQPYLQLAKYYQSADAALFPKQCSLSYFDTQACALPVIVEDNTINIGRIDHNNGFLFTSGSVDDFREKIQQMLALPEAALDSMRMDSEEFIIKHYNYENIAKQYMDIIQKVVSDFRTRKSSKE